MKKGRPTVSTKGEIGRQVGPVGKSGRGKEWQSIGLLAGKLMRDVNRKR
ncbi:hypothetical protein [Ancylobacter oerskovii]|uniref:Uncharacterized protein n=1 Tax=Ancylobacter oerskovii TaxID=459519 RepID=A0ABW4Z153_9HYPH|nr:hypothetical protein [Ancylobacter oerskovii]MBS7545087.1 hypothetical protein [Ancylobacter oerskovii]